MKKRIFWLMLIFLFLPAAARAEVKPAWKYVTVHEIGGSPAVAAGNAIVATKGGALVALDNNGKVLWQQKLPAGSLAAPAVDANGDIYVACADGSVLRCDAKGKTLWQAGLKQRLMASPLLGKDAVFAASVEGRVAKIAKKDGAILKQAELGMPVRSSPVWDAGRKNLLVPGWQFALFALSQELKTVWKFATKGVVYSTPAVTPANEVYLTSMDHHLYKLDGNGRLLWTFKAQRWIKASPVVDEKGRVYFGSYDRNFYALSAEGKPLWRYQVKAQITASAVIDEAGNLYCGDTSGTVYALEGDGKLAWQHKSPDFISSDLTILPAKLLLAGSIDGTLLAFRIDRPLSRRAWWAKCLGNLANSGFDEP